MGSVGVVLVYVVCAGAKHGAEHVCVYRMRHTALSLETGFSTTPQRVIKIFPDS